MSEKSCPIFVMYSLHEIGLIIENIVCRFLIDDKHLNHTLFQSFNFLFLRYIYVHCTVSNLKEMFNFDDFSNKNVIGYLIPVCNMQTNTREDSSHLVDDVILFQLFGIF